MSLSKAEQETIILFDEAEPTATIETCNRKLRNQLDRYCLENNECSLLRSNDVSAKYVCPKSWVKVRRPRQLTEKQKQELAERARRNLAGAHRQSRDEVTLDV